MRGTVHYNSMLSQGQGFTTISRNCGKDGNLGAILGLGEVGTLMLDMLLDATTERASHQRERRGNAGGCLAAVS